MTTPPPPFFSFVKTDVFSDEKFHDFKKLSGDLIGNRQDYGHQTDNLSANAQPERNECAEILVQTV